MSLTPEQIASIRAANKLLVDSAPPFGPEQRDRLAAALQPVRRRFLADNQSRGAA